MGRPRKKVGYSGRSRKSYARRSKGYDVTFGEIEINDKDKNANTGVLYPAVKVTMNKQNELQFYLFQNPWKLTNIIDWTKGKD